MDPQLNACKGELQKVDKRKLMSYCCSQIVLLPKDVRNMEKSNFLL